MDYGIPAGQGARKPVILSFVTQERRRRVATLGTFLAISLFVMFVTLPFASGFMARLVPSRVEKTVGAQMVQRVAEESYFCRDPQGLAALQELMDAMLAGQDLGHDFHVYVVDDNHLNAFAAPGGHIVLNRAVIDQAQHPHEVAGVLAHEMAHVMGGHPTRGLVEGLGYGIFRFLVPGNALVMTPKVLEDLLISHHSRADELEADRLGMEILNAAGLDSHGLTEYLERLQAKGPMIPGAADYFSSHPSSDERKSAIARLSREGNPPLSSESWSRLKAICARMGEPAHVGSRPRAEAAMNPADDVTR